MIEVLIVDDDDLVRESLGMVLRREGFSVTLASRGEEALRAAERQSYDVVLADVRMPGMDGLQVVARVRDRMPDAHFMLITGYASEETAVEALRLRVDAYIRKPFDMQGFLEQLRGVCRERLRRRGNDPSRLLRGLAAALETRRPSWGARVRRVARLCREVGQRLGLSPPVLETLELAALVHDLAAGPPESTGVASAEGGFAAADRLDQVADLLARLGGGDAMLEGELRTAAQVLLAAVSGEAPDPTVSLEVQRVAEALPSAPAPAVERAGPSLRLDIQTLGDFSVRVDGAPVARESWESARARWLLVYLLTQRGRRVSQDRLGGLFWPDSDPGRARRALLGNVHRARKALGLPEAIRTDDRYYAFNTSTPYRWDLEEMERSFRQGRAQEDAGDREAAARAYLQVEGLYRGPFLEECPDDWAEEIRRLARDQAVEGLSRLAALLLDRDPGMAEQKARRALSLEASAEPAYAVLIRSLASRGRRDEAVRVYHQCRDNLEQLLDLPPGPEVTRAYLEILEGGGAGVVG